jgi:RHS repeat-associated protein
MTDEQTVAFGPYPALNRNFYLNGHLVIRFGFGTSESLVPYPTLFLQYDQIGSSRETVDVKSGSIKNTDYYPFGGYITPPTDILYQRFTGKERDSESGNDYFGARYYGSSTGRFLSPDSQDPSDALPFVGIDPMPYGDTSNPQSLNLYSYVYNNPLSRTDSDGHDVNVCTTGSNGQQQCTEMTNDQYKAAQQAGNGGLNVPTLDQVGMTGNGSGQFNAMNITDGNGNVVGTATYISDGGADYYANRNGVDFINTQTAPVVNAMGWATVGSVGVMMGAEVAPVVGEATAALRYRAALQAWKTLSAATGAAKLIGEFFKTGNVPPGLTPEMMKAYLDLAKAYLAAGMGTAGGIMQSGIGTQANRIQQLENYLGR